ncbi:MAG: hypothetical protein WBW80_19965 [Acidimicrobiales bacterium]
MEVTQYFWRRPLSAVTDAFADAGFSVERTVEPQPGPSALERFPEALAGLAGVPSFIVYRIVLNT